MACVYVRAACRPFWALTTECAACEQPLCVCVCLCVCVRARCARSIIYSLIYTLSGLSFKVDPIGLVIQLIGQRIAPIGHRNEPIGL